MDDDNTTQMRQKMNVSHVLDSLLMFKENQGSPCVKLNMVSIPVKILNDTISKNSFLTLPRITSQVRTILLLKLIAELNL